MKGRAYVVTAAVAILLAGCGGAGMEAELAQVPDLCFLHVHLEEGARLSFFSELVGEFVPIPLLDSLLSKGDVGVTLLGMNLGDFTPRLLFLSRSVSPAELAELCASRLGGRPDTVENGYLITDQRGSIRGAVAERDGWTSLFTGSGSDRTATRWLSMKREESLAGDSNLVSVCESDHDLSILVPENFIGFISAIPTGMLDRRQASYFNRIRGIISRAGIKAVRLSMDVRDDEPEYLLLEFRMVRRGGNRTSLTVGFGDSEIPPDILVEYLENLLDPDIPR